MSIRKYRKHFLERHKIARYTCVAVLALVGVLFIIWIFSWDSLLGWIITKEKSDLYAFVFWAIIAILVILVAIMIEIIRDRKKK